MSTLSIPGPWRLDDPMNAHVLDENDGYHIIEGDSGNQHFRATAFMPLDVARAMAAAPELLEALRTVRDWMDNPELPICPLDVTMASAIRIAIAKAEKQP